MVNPHPVEAGFGDRLDESLGGVRGVEQLAVAVLRRQRHLACRIDDDVAARQRSVVLAAGDDLDVVRAECQRVVQILHLASELGGVVLVAGADLGEVELVCDALKHEAVGHMGPHVPQSDNADAIDSHAPILPAS